MVQVFDKYGKLEIEFTGGGSGGVQYTDGQVTPANPIGTLAVFNDAGIIKAVSVANPLPVAASISTAGLATEDKQDDEIAELIAILAKLEGSIAVTGTFFQTTQPVSGTVAVSNLPATQPISGTVAVNNFPATQPVSGTVSVGNFPATQPVSGTLASTVADGANVVEGAVADAIVSAGAAGTLSAKLRRVTQGLEDLKSLIVLAAGSNIIGKVGIDQTTPGTTNLVALTAETTKVIGTVNIAGAQTLANVTTLGTITNTVPVKAVRAATPAQTSVSVTNSTTSILAANANRLGATIYNEGSAICYMKLGSTASLTSYTLQIASGGYYELPFNYTGAIDGITSASTAQLRITELSL